MDDRVGPVRMGVKGCRIILAIGLAALGFLWFVFNSSGHKIPLSTNLGFAGAAFGVLLLIIFTPRILR